MPPVGHEPALPPSEGPQTHALGHGYIGARNDTTQHVRTDSRQGSRNQIHCCLCQRLH